MLAVRISICLLTRSASSALNMKRIVNKGIFPIKRNSGSFTFPLIKDSVLKPLGGAKRGRSHKSEQGTESHSGPKQGVRAPRLPCLSSMGVRMRSCGGDEGCPDLACKGESPNSLKGQLCVEGDDSEGRF